MRRGDAGTGRLGESVTRSNGDTVTAQMPARPVESHVASYKRTSTGFSRCHGLVPWSITLQATRKARQNSPDATGSSRGVSRCELLKRSTPRKPDATGSPRGVSRCELLNEPNLKQRCHVASSWHQIETGISTNFSERLTPTS